ncbi:helix-turn-helix domain-containing protein [Caulobacter sp. KR2-114]|uniref:helix-turn-helix domain-containing protein n=1 Tax=Caulobacter sp. KR2-114 TaxID=3400912 RepID=UPI003C04740A
MQSQAVIRVEPAHADAEPWPNAVIVMQLLERGLRDMEADAGAARGALERARSLLEAGRALRAAPDNIVRPGCLAPWQARRVKAHIEAKLDETLPTAELAAITRLSPHYFARAFKQTFGAAPHAYVLSRRVERAKEMMLTSDDALSHIAVACGFSDQAHFTRRFHQAVGATPHAWRTRMAGPALRAAS